MDTSNENPLSNQKHQSQKKRNNAYYSKKTMHVDFSPPVVGTDPILTKYVFQVDSIYASTPSK